LGGMLNQPVSCGGAVVNPGDIVICDENGVLVLPPGDVDEVVAAALERQARGRANLGKLRDGARLGDLSGACALVQQDSLN
jgi:4-hydroxy-4-methyl-2-oxoglutarate aldolase